MSDQDEGGSDAPEAWLRAVAHVPAIERPESAVGETIGRYRIERVLGEGGMGIVYLARDEQLDRIVALKVLPARSLGDEDRRRRFIREARIAAGLNDPHIATIYDVGEVGERVFFAMEYVSGKTLRALLRERERLAIDEVVRIGAAIARGLGRAHSSGIVHRDVKPDNVMIGDDGVKILDFGVAKLEPRDVDANGEQASTLETREGALVGTPAYMSPEQARGMRVDARTDVFALGVTLYEMASGRRPFEGATPLDVLIAIGRDAPPPLSAARREVPRWLEGVVATCLEKERDDRYADARDVLRALEARANPASPRGRRGALVGAFVVAAAVAGWAAVRDRVRPEVVRASAEPSASAAVVASPHESASASSTVIASETASALAPTSTTATSRGVRGAPPPTTPPARSGRPVATTPPPTETPSASAHPRTGPLDEPK